MDSSIVMHRGTHAIPYLVVLVSAVFALEGGEDDLPVVRDHGQEQRRHALNGHGKRLNERNTIRR